MLRRLFLLLVVTLGLLVTPVVAGIAKAGAQPVARLSAVRAAAHPGYDRLVFQFAGPLPSVHLVTWVKQVVYDASGKTMVLPGKAFVRVVFKPASAHTSTGQVSVSYSGFVGGVVHLRVLHAVKLAGDFEAVLSFGVGLGQKTRFDAFTLTKPARLIIDFAVPRG